MKIHKIEQQTTEWFEIKKGKMSASHAQAIGNCGKGLDTYINNLMAEYYSSAEKENYTNADMERGNELEAQARSIYELENGSEVEEVGFIEMNEYAGCSPDGLIRDDGLIEIKCLNDTKHFKMILNGEKEIESKYIWQMQMQMLVANRKWCDFVAYNPNFKQSLFVFRIYPDTEKQSKIGQGLKKGEEMIKTIKQKYEKRLHS